MSLFLKKKLGFGRKKTLNLMFRRKQFDVTVFKEQIGIWEKKKT